MNEKNILICGHGSGNPSLKIMYDYLSNRQANKASNGKTKGLVEVVRFLDTDEQRKQFHDLYKTILGRNVYNQSLRMYCYTPYKEIYYSDCSSSGCLTYEKCGISGVKYYNTASMHYSGAKVDVAIENGHIKESDLSKLRVGDALLFRGNDPSRPLQIGHVEYVYEIPNIEGWAEENGKWYYYKDGERLKKSWVIDKERKYRVGNNGEMLTGWHQIYDDKAVLRWYYFDSHGILWHETSQKDGSMEEWVIKEE